MNIPISLFVLSLMLTLKYAKAVSGMRTCQRSASDHTIFNEMGISARIPAPIMHPRYAEKAPHIPYQRAKTIIKATAKYMLETPGAGEMGDLTTANLDKSEFNIVRKRKTFRYVDTDSISGIITSPLNFIYLAAACLPEMIS